MASDPVEQLLTFLIANRPRLTTTPPGTPRQLAAGGLTRAEGLLRGLQLVIGSGREDLAGLFTRAVWECWCVGLYVLFGGQAAYDELVESHRRWIKNFAERWPLDDLEVVPGYLEGVGSAPKAPKFEVMAQRVEEMLRTRDTGPIAYGSISSYDVFYRLESTFSAHAGLALFERYLTVSDDGTREEILEVPHQDTLRRKAAAIAASYTGHLAWHVYKEFGIATTAIEAILGALIEEGGMYATPAGD